MDYELGFKGKTVIVTGAASGIGKATALAFAEKGAGVVIADINRKGGAEIAAQIESKGGKALFVECDTANAADADRCAREAIERFEKIDILVNNAGIEFNDRGNIVTMPYGTLDRILKVDLYGYIHMLRSVVPHMQPGGKIVNVSSLQGLATHLPGTSYQVAKAGILGLTRALAIEYAPHGINVNAVAPGAIATEGMGASRSEDPKILDPYRKRIPMGRRGWPQEVAGPILFLASDLASYVNGATLLVDGGYSANLTPDLGEEVILQPNDPDK